MAFGDRKDGRLMRELDSLHYITGIIYPNRCDNEAFLPLRIDYTKTNEYIKKKNAERPEIKYNHFQIIATAVLKLLTLKPKMNRFIVNSNFYQRNEVSTSFVVKKSYEEDGAEALAFIHAVPEDTLDTIRVKMKEQIDACRSEAIDESTQAMDFLTKMPRFLSKFLVHILMWLDKHGWIPKDIIATDPYYSSAVLSNLGSIRMKSGYHHLTNWGTCSMIMLIGERKKRPFFDRLGGYEMRDSVELGLTIDERLADGFYYAGCVQLLQKLIENPELLEGRLDEPVA